MRKQIVCEDCEASYQIKHDMEERYYTVSFCPFCGAETDLMDDLEDEDEYDS
jgi:hydrogenase maturation factor HypF (carbamoyltransferase family)